MLITSILAPSLVSFLSVKEEACRDSPAPKIPWKQLYFAVWLPSPALPKASSLAFIFRQKFLAVWPFFLTPGVRRTSGKHPLTYPCLNTVHLPSCGFKYFIGKKYTRWRGPDGNRHLQSHHLVHGEEALLFTFSKGILSAVSVVVFIY